MGGILILEAMMTMALLRRKICARAKAMIIWYPHAGKMPMNNPNPTEADFIAGDSLGLVKASRKILLKFFF